MFFIYKKFRIFEVPSEYTIHPLTTRTTRVFDGVELPLDPEGKNKGSWSGMCLVIGHHCVIRAFNA